MAATGELEVAKPVVAGAGTETVEPTAGLEEPAGEGAPVWPTGELEVAVDSTRVVDSEKLDDETTVLAAGQSVTSGAHEVMVSYSVL